MLDWVKQASFVHERNELLRPLPIVIDAHDVRTPIGRRDRREVKEARLETFGPNVFSQPSIWASLHTWWLAHGGNTPNWDLATSCILEDRKALLLVEAKANLPELSTAGRRLVGGRKKKDGSPRKFPSEKAKINDAHIRRAVARAGRAFAKLGAGKAFTASSHYQLANRLAFAWRLACLSVPVTLLFLGFCGDHGIASVGEPFACEEHWYPILRAHLSPYLAIEGQERRFAVNRVPVWIAMRGRYVLSQSPPVGV